MTNQEKKWVLIIMLLAGLVIGGLIGEFSSNIPGLWWLRYGNEFGLTNPLTLDLGVIRLTFGFVIKITVSSIIGLVIAIFAYNWIK